LFSDAVVAPAGPPVCEVIAVAKRDLKSGEMLDGIGGFCCYGMIDNAQEALSAKFLPMGLAEGCRLKNPVKKDQPIAYRHVELPENRFCDELRRKQIEHFL
jgi:predicted homoserine dehydrogenase-like protein